MKRISLATQRAAYDIVIGAPLAELGQLIELKSALLIFEKAVAKRVEDASLNVPKEMVEGGEELKDLRAIEDLYRTFLRHGLDKSATIVAIGGGALTDAVAYAAATFHRGMPCVTVPTTLLAQVDASIGGKNGVNFEGVKNLIGTIVQPKLVLCDFEFLTALPKEEISFGVAEIIKAAVIADEELFDQLDNSASQLRALDQATLRAIVSQAVQIKADIVSRDETENDERMKLNFGHTIGHALEVACNLPHGAAVACGMVMESKLAARLGLCEPSVAQRIASLCCKFDLPTWSDYDAHHITQLMLQDKKKRGTTLRFALPQRIGNVELKSVATNDIEKHLSDLRSAQ